jgi:creatinine amidohydrolase
MTMRWIGGLAIGALALGAARIAGAPPPPARGPGVLLEERTWVEARRLLTPESIVVIPLGAAAKEHGPHLPLRNDWTMAEYFKRRVLEKAQVIVAPTINYHFYPAFVEYPGSTSLRFETARDLTVDVVRSLAHHGPRRFYVLNTGVSTARPLAAAAGVLERDGIVLRFTDIIKAAESVEKAVRQEKEGTHADEIETSMMLYIDPDSVDMSRATKDYPAGEGPLTPNRDQPGGYSPSGIYGDATLATRDKGRQVVEATVQAILKDLDDLRRQPLPSAR